MQKTLAIVIPAYKSDYLERTLQSLAEQTDQAFTVYIGDDASPSDLRSIVMMFSDSLNLHYHRFETNLGKTDLVAHWQRCINMCRGEEWICLFSDDDIMERRCVEAFHQCSVPDSVNVLHFNIDIVDADGYLLQSCPPFPEQLTVNAFFNQLFRRQIVARMPEFFFRNVSLQSTGIIPFDLAWRSDTATVMQNAAKGSILSITGPETKVLWRSSHTNISGIDNLKGRKNVVNIDYFNWTYDFFERNPPLPMSRFFLLKTIVFSLEKTNNRELLKDEWRAATRLKAAKGVYFIVFLLLILYRILYRE